MCVRRTAADVTTEQTSHESRSYKSLELRAGRITARSMPESKTSGGFASRGTAVLSSRRLLPVESRKGTRMLRRLNFVSEFRVPSSDDPFFGDLFFSDLLF